MTVQEIINRADTARENEISEEQKIKWLFQFDKQIYEDIISKTVSVAEEPTEYTTGTDELLLGERFAELYTLYLFSKIDYEKAEFNRYQNDSAIFNDEYNKFKAYYIKNNLPRQDNTIKVNW